MPLRCYYEVLQVDRDASLDDIKSAFKRLALKCHPDKRPENERAEATHRFQEMQQAYNVLSDPNERSWYDKHRDSILNGGDGTATSSEGVSSINLWPYFNSSCYDEYNDADRGFYTVYRDLFERIDEEEQQDGEGSDDEIEPRPSFGNSLSEAQDVQRFYSFWLAFATRKAFHQHDIYNPNTAPNRQVKRMMEKENKKERDRARKSYNEQVRKLVEFVQKRDRRMKEITRKMKEDSEMKASLEAMKKQQLLNEKRQKVLILEQEHQKLLEERERERKEKKKKPQARETETEDNGVESEDVDEDVGGDESEDNERGNEEVNNKKSDTQFVHEKEKQEFYCVACHKSFKSEKQWKNHEASKKHKEKIVLLKKLVTLERDLQPQKKDLGESDDQEDQEQYEQEDEDHEQQEEEEQPEQQEEEKQPEQQEEEQLEQQEQEEQPEQQEQEEQQEQQKIKTPSRVKKRLKKQKRYQKVNPISGTSSSSDSDSTMKLHKKHDEEKEEGKNESERKQDSEGNSSNAPPVKTKQLTKKQQRRAKLKLEQSAKLNEPKNGDEVKGKKEKKSSSKKTTNTNNNL